MRIARSHGARGYVLLAVLLVLAALVFLVGVGLRRAGDEGLSGSLVSSDAQALALAELGLERTRAYLGVLLERDVDLDRALDPSLDTDCSNLLALSGPTTDDDNLPTFTDGAADTVTVASSGKVYRRVVMPGGAGAYLVRIDDNDDDGLDLSAFSASTFNNPGPGNTCVEGLGVGTARTNPVRDRDRTVWVTVIGLFPGTDPALATARRTLRVLVGPGESAGIVVGGTIDMGGNSHVCGAYGDVMANGSVQGGCLCGAGCSSGPPWQSCGAGNTCTAQSGGGTCTASSGGAQGECVSGAPVPPPPPVSPWDVSNAPARCATPGPGCTPFYYLRKDGGGTVRLSAWNYATCPDPRTGPRICGPTDCATCWVPLDAATVGTDIRMSYADPNLTSALPNLSISGPGAPLLWSSSGGLGHTSGAGGCDTNDTSAYPGGSGFGPRDIPNVVFEYKANPGAPNFHRLPRGIWFVEGNVRFQTEETPNCATLTADPTYGASIIATGNIVHAADTLSFVPASSKGYVLLAGRDFEIQGGNGRLYTCGRSAAVMVHEQFKMGANQHLEAQLVVEAASTCSTQVTGVAVQMSGNGTIKVPTFPPVGVGQPARALLVSESTH